MRARLDRYGRSCAEEAGIRLRDTPEPLYQLLVLVKLLLAGSRPRLAQLAAVLVRVSRGKAAAQEVTAAVGA